MIAAESRAARDLEMMISFLRPYIDTGAHVPNSIAQAIYETLREMRRDEE